MMVKKILFVVYDNESHISWFPQGIAYLASAVRDAGHEVTIYSQDIHHYSEEHLTKYLNENKFDVVAISTIGGYYQHDKLLLLSDAINSSKNRPYFIIGGHGPAPEIEYFLKKTKADAVGIGEGEITIVELLDALGDVEKLKKVKGIAFRDGDSVEVTQRRELIENIDEIKMPAYDLFDMNHYRLLRLPGADITDFVMPMLSGRGCTFECNFCYRLDKGFRPRSAESIIEEMKFLHETYGITYIAFSDELLMSSVERTKEFCEKLISSGLKIKWNCNGRLNYAKPELIKLMKESGCVFINYGIEAFDNQILKNMNKALTTDIIEAGVQATYNAGVGAGLNIIFGNIGENEETLQKGVDFLLKYDQHDQLRTIRPVTPYPGSPLYDEAISRGLLKDVEDFYTNKHTNSDLVSINFTELTNEEFDLALLKANSVLLENYYNHQKESSIKIAEDLYKNRNANFRGFRRV